MLTGIHPRRRKFIVAVNGHIFNGGFATYFPNPVVGSSQPKPRLQDVPHAIAFVLLFEKPPRVLQPKPELHETFLGVVDHVKVISDK